MFNIYWLYTHGSSELNSCLCDTEFWINSFNHPETKVFLINQHHKITIILIFVFLNLWTESLLFELIKILNYIATNLLILSITMKLKLLCTMEKIISLVWIRFHIKTTKSKFESILNHLNKTVLNATTLHFVYCGTSSRAHQMFE